MIAAISVGRPPGWFIAVEICATVLLAVGFIPLGYPGLIKRRYGVPIPESRPLKENLSGFLTKIGEGGLDDYRKELRSDLIFAILFGVLLAALTRQLFVAALTRTTAAFSPWILVPIGYLTSDVMEDLLLSFAVRPTNIRREEGRITLSRPWLCVIARVLTFAKFTLVLATGVALFVGCWLLVSHGYPS